MFVDAVEADLRQVRIIPPKAERAMAERAQPTMVRVNRSHVVMMTQPRTVTRVILDTLRLQR